MANWGSDESGPIVGYLFEQGSAPKPIDSRAADAGNATRTYRRLTRPILVAVFQLGQERGTAPWRLPRGTCIKVGRAFNTTSEFLEHLLRSQAYVLVDIVRTVTSH